MRLAGDTEIQDESAAERSRQLSLQGSQPPVEPPGYSVVRRLGTGAYGVVWLAREDRTGRMVAIKFYPHRHGLNWAMLNREVEKLAAVYTSRNIVRLLDVGWNSDPPWFVMEYVENGSLGTLLARGPLTVDESVRLGKEICSALIDAHGAGVLHCDLKPDNVLLDGQRSARLCDFGQARMSHEQSPALGTLYYMSPEQADPDAAPDARWDVYAVGALLYHMLTGQPPHRTEPLQAQLQSAETIDERLRIYRDAVRGAGIPTAHRRLRQVDPRLSEILERCLAVNPVERFPNAQAVLDAFEARDRQRARRPLLAVGLLVPLLLAAALIPIFVSALRENLRDAEQQLTRRALESDALSARLQAAALEDELQDRLDELQSLAAGDELRQELQALLLRPASESTAEMLRFAEASFDARPRWMQLLDRAWQRSQTASATRSRGTDTSWFLTDAAGVQIWRRDFSERTLGDTFAWRDYFHGRGLDYPRDSVPADIQPLSEPHVSLAYKSTTTGRQTVALSVPVRNQDGQVIGVFARTAHLGDLQSRLRGQMTGKGTATVERVIALAEIRNDSEIRLLDHPCLTEEFLRTAEQNSADSELFQQLKLDPAIAARITTDASLPEAGEVRLSFYADPIGLLTSPAARTWSGEWMAALSPVKRTSWMVIVQERREGVLLPVQNMAGTASRQAWLAVSIAVAVVAVVWLFVFRAFNHSGQPSQPPSQEA
ncbi:MAG: serine/threonine protein kinase [Planctomycetota bacterium]